MQLLYSKMEYGILTSKFTILMVSQDKIKFYRKLGAKILQARIDSGLEQGDVASKIGKTQSYISKVETGDIKVDLYTLTLLVKVLKKPIGYFITE